MQTRRAVLGKLLTFTMAGAALVAGGCAVNPIVEASTLFQEGMQLFNAKRYDEAIAKFREATVKDPNNWNAYLGMARSFIAKGVWPDAITAGRRAFELAPQGADVAATFFQALLGGGTEALNGGRFLDSIKYLTEYLRHQPTNASAWTNVGKAYMGNKQFADGLGALTKALGLSGGDRGDILKNIFGGGLQAFSERDYGSHRADARVCEGRFAQSASLSHAREILLGIRPAQQRAGGVSRCAENQPHQWRGAAIFEAVAVTAGAL
jgi:tetratricopeptide (TPR) repeat protein